MKQEKQLLLDEIQEQIKEFPDFIIMRYERLSANDVHQFRRDIAKIGGNVEVMRKRVLLKAAESAGIPLTLEALPGHIALVFSGEDFIATAKQVYDLRSKTEKAVEVLGGRLEEKLYEQNDVEKLSKLPGKEEMQAQFLGLLEAPMSETLGAIDAILTSVLHCIENHVGENKEAN